MFIFGAKYVCTAQLKLIFQPPEFTTKVSKIEQYQNRKSFHEAVIDANSLFAIAKASEGTKNRLYAGHEAVVCDRCFENIVAISAFNTGEKFYCSRKKHFAVKSKALTILWG